MPFESNSFNNLRNEFYYNASVTISPDEFRERNFVKSTENTHFNSIHMALMQKIINNMPKLN